MATATHRPPAPSAARALLSLLDEPRSELRAHALRRLRDVVDLEWSAVATSVASIEAMCEDETFGGRLDAALLASKVRARVERARGRGETRDRRRDPGGTRDAGREVDAWNARDGARGGVRVTDDDVCGDSR